MFSQQRKQTHSNVSDIINQIIFISESQLQQAINVRIVFLYYLDKFLSCELSLKCTCLTGGALICSVITVDSQQVMSKQEQSKRIQIQLGKK